MAAAAGFFLCFVESAAMGGCWRQCLRCLVLHVHILGKAKKGRIAVMVF